MANVRGHGDCRCGRGGRSKFALAVCARRHFTNRFEMRRADGSRKRAIEWSATYRSDLGLCQWFNFEDHRLDDAVRWLRRLGVKHLRTGISWADSFPPNAEQWFDRQMNGLEESEVTLTF